jgi:hypothetical protein
MEAVSFGGADRIDNLSTLMKKAFTTGSRPPILFVEKLRRGSPRLLLPLGGHISNALVEQQLRETQHLRKFRVVATSQDNPDEPREVTTPTQVEALRAEKKRLIAGRNDLDEFGVLDPKIRYELWSKAGPEAQPHVDSFRTSRATDSIYILFTRLPAHSSSGEAVLSVQSLHVLGLAAMSLFHSPYETLGNAAESFRKAALQSMKAANSFGFEAILKVERDQSFDPPETPRRFEGWPSLSRVKLSVQAEPTPIVR